MALIFADGFLPDFFPASFYGGWWSSAAQFQISNQGAGNSRYGTFSRVGIFSALSSAEIYSDIGGSRTTLISGIAFAFNDRQRVVGSFLRFQEGSTVHVAVGFDESGYITAWRGDTTTLLVSTNKRALFGLGDKRWYYLEVQVTVSDTVGSISIWVDGQLISTTTNIDTRNGGTGIIDRVSVGFTASGQTVRTQTYIDDFYCLDTTGTLNNSRLGGVCCGTLTPTADSSVSWTPNAGTNNWSRVELADAGLYVTSSTAGQRDLYVVTDYPDPPYNINIKAVEVVAFALSDTNTADTMKLIIKPASTVYSTSTFPVNSSTYGSWRVFNVWELNPETSAAWTRSEVNALTLGIEK